jgi:RNA-directed DNA polymerase
MLKANGQRGVPQGGVISPLLSNLYLTEVDSMLERAKETTRFGKYTYIIAGIDRTHPLESDH